MLRTNRGPARLLPLLYLGTAHIALTLASLLAALWPQAVAGFFYHSRMVALVHLVTIGWITFSILGAIYIVGPIALRMDMAPRRMDSVAYALALIGLIGMVAHFWIQEYAGGLVLIRQSVLHFHNDLAGQQLGLADSAGADPT